VKARDLNPEGGIDKEFAYAYWADETLPAGI
jgi:hypothetical protein